MPIPEPPSLPVNAISAYVLDLHRTCHELPLRAFQEHCFDRLSSVVEHDSGLVAVGTLPRGVPTPHDAYVHGQPTERLMESWERVKHLDVVAAAALSKPGRTHRFASEEVFADAPAMLAHCRTFGLAHVLCTAGVDGRAGHYYAFSIYRADPERAFTDVERETVELLVPHVIEAMRQARLEQLRRATRIPKTGSRPAAILSPAGVLLEADPELVELMVEAHPQWSGPYLPPSLASLAAARSSERQTIGRLVFRVDPGDGLLLLQARRVTIVDDLTERELEVARLFASGESTKQVAEKLSISPNTVRVHLGRIYEKLGVVNKAELASMLAGYD